MPVLAFVQRDVPRDAPQQEFIDEVRSWTGGVFTGDFSSADELSDAVTRALHELELTQQAGPVDEAEMTDRARALIPDRHGTQGAALSGHLAKYSPPSWSVDVPGRRFGSVTAAMREGLGSGFQEWRKMVKWVLSVTCAARR